MTLLKEALGALAAAASSGALERTIGHETSSGQHIPSARLSALAAGTIGGGDASALAAHVILCSKCALQFSMLYESSLHHEGPGGTRLLDVLNAMLACDGDDLAHSTTDYLLLTHAHGSSLRDCIASVRRGHGRLALRELRLLLEGQRPVSDALTTRLAALLRQDDVTPEQKVTRAQGILASAPKDVVRQALTEDEQGRALRHYGGVLAAREEPPEARRVLAVLEAYAAHAGSPRVRSWARLLSAKLAYQTDLLDAKLLGTSNPPDAMYPPWLVEPDPAMLGNPVLAEEARRWRNWHLAYRAIYALHCSWPLHDITDLIKEVEDGWRHCDSAPERSFATLTLARLCARRLRDSRDSADLDKVARYLLLAASQAAISQLTHEYATALMTGAVLVHRLGSTTCFFQGARDVFSAAEQCATRAATYFQRLDLLGRARLARDLAQALTTLEAQAVSTTHPRLASMPPGLVQGQELGTPRQQPSEAEQGSRRPNRG